MGCTGPPCGSSPRRPQKAHIADITGLHRFGDGSDRILDRHVRIATRVIGGSATFSDVGRFIAYNEGVQLILDSHN
jgi:hypothetical protein